MEDLEREIVPDNIVSPKMRKMLDKEKRATRKRIIERGLVHFRQTRVYGAAFNHC